MVITLDRRRTGGFCPILCLVLGLLLGLGLSLNPLGPAAAQTRSPKAPDADLSTLTQVRVTASQTTPDAVNCGPDLGELLPRVEAELASNGLRIVETPEHLVTVSILTAHDEARGICSSAAMLGAYQLVSFYDEVKGGLRSGYVVLWQRGKQVFSTPTDHAAAVETAVNRLAQLFLGDWRAGGTVAQRSSQKAQ